MAELREWIKALPGGTNAALVHDPLRTKVLFLEALPRDEARSLVSDCIDALRQEAEQAKEDCRKSANDKCPFSHFAARNAFLVTRVRIRWLNEVQKELEKRAGC